jgi:hypothetical protein
MAKRYSIDNGLLNLLCKDAKGNLWNSFLDITFSKGLYLKNRNSLFLANEMQFLEYIGLGKILEEAPPTLRNAIKYHVNCLFNQQKLIELEELNRTLDTIFKQCLIVCEALPKIKPQALLAQHEKHLNHLPNESARFLDRAISNQYLEGLNTNPQNVYKKICHNLTWQLATTTLRSAFNDLPTNIHPDLILRFFEPLMAIVHNSALTHGSPPNFFRLAEVAYLSYVRKHKKKFSSEQLAWIQEYIQKYQTGKDKDLVDCVYLDWALLGYLDMTNGELQQFPVTVLTMDSPIEILNRLKLLRNVLEKLKSEVEGWSLNPIYSCKVLCLEQINGRLELKDTVEHAIQLSHNPQN